MNTTTTPSSPRRSRRVLAVGAVAAGISVVCAGGAMAVAPESAVSRTIAGALQDVGIHWEGMPEGYTPDQYTAFWGAGYTSTDANALAELWQIDLTDAKARAGQMLVDGQTPPIAPGTHPEVVLTEEGDRLDALWDAGYTSDDVEALAALWGTDLLETKVRAAVTLVEGQTLPVPPSGTAVSGS